MEAELSSSVWLAGETFTLADTAMIPYVMRLDMLSMSAIWENGRLPNVQRWLSACKQRPAFKSAVWEWLPDHLKKDLNTFGAQSWPNVAVILGID